MAKRLPKQRTLRLQDGGTFRIGPKTLTVDVSDIPWTPPAEVLHVNQSCGCLELPLPDEPPAWFNVTEPPALRISADDVVALVELVNQSRFRASVTSKRQRPEHLPVVLPPQLLRLAKHAAAAPKLVEPFPGESLGYAGTVNRAECLWVHRTTGAAMLEVETTPGNVKPRDVGHVQRTHEWRKLSARRAVEWLAANGYRAIPATLHRVARIGGDDESPDNER
jgi:hypothetical protein